MCVSMCVWGIKNQLKWDHAVLINHQLRIFCVKIAFNTEISFRLWNMLWRKWCVCLSCIFCLYGIEDPFKILCRNIKFMHIKPRWLCMVRCWCVLTYNVVVQCVVIVIITIITSYVWWRNFVSILWSYSLYLYIFHNF